MLTGLVCGCSLGGDEEPAPATGAPRAIAEVVRELERAVAERDWPAVCEDIFMAAARERAGAGKCAALLRSSAEGVRRPRIAIAAIEVRGERARVRVRAGAAGEAAVGDVLELRRESGEWRVEALAG